MERDDSVPSGGLFTDDAGSERAPAAEAAGGVGPVACCVLAIGLSSFFFKKKRQRVARISVCLWVFGHGRDCVRDALLQFASGPFGQSARVFFIPLLARVRVVAQFSFFSPCTRPRHSPFARPLFSRVLLCAPLLISISGAGPFGPLSV
nr:hypothetical protein [Pandoravirus massiliensis]